MRKDVGRTNVLYVHVTLLPALAATGELKTKPTQHSVKELRGIGIQPDVIVLRSDQPVSDEVREKIALFCDVAQEGVITAETAATIYEVPLLLEAQGLGDLVVRELGLGGHRQAGRPDRLAGPGGPHQAAQAGARDRPGGQVHRAARRLPLGHRGAAPRRLGARPHDPGPLGRLGDADAGERRRPAGRRGRRARAGRLRPSRHRGQGAGRAPRARAQGALPGPVPGPAVRRHRVRARRRRRAGGQLDRVRPVHARPGHRLHARPARHGGQGRHDAAGPLPGPPHARLEGGRGVRQRGHLRAPPPPLRGQQPVPRAAGGGRA